MPIGYSRPTPAGGWDGRGQTPPFRSLPGKTCPCGPTVGSGEEPAEREARSCVPMGQGRREGLFRQ